jgi:hypothetical protein
MAKAINKLLKPLLAFSLLYIKKVFNVKTIGGFAAKGKFFFNKDKMSCESQT